ncbi:hypothetical protein Tco_1577418 [Tanacetum coccineum]
MSLPVMDDFFSTLSDDEASYHEDASENVLQTNNSTTIQNNNYSFLHQHNIKYQNSQFLRRMEYDIWAMEMEHYMNILIMKFGRLFRLEIQRRRNLNWKDGGVRYFPPASALQEILAVEKEKELNHLYLWPFAGIIFGKHHVLKYQLEMQNHKFLRSLPQHWVFEHELTSTSKSSASAQNVAFVSHSKSSNNKVKSGHTGPYSTYTPSLFKQIFQKRMFLWECTSKGTNDGKKRDSFYQDQGAGKKEQNQNCLLTMDDGVVNWGEHTVEEEETQSLHSWIPAQKNEGEQEAKILAYTIAVKKLEAQVVTFQKQQLSLNEQLTFQANEIYAHKDEKRMTQQNVNTVRPNDNTGRTNVNSVRQNVNSVRYNVNTGSFKINTGRSKQPVPTTNSFSPVRPRGNRGTAVKTSAGYNWRRTRPNSNYNSGSNFVRTDHPLKKLWRTDEYLIVVAQGHDGNKDRLDDFEECKGGSVTFRVERLHNWHDENQIIFLKSLRQKQYVRFVMKDISLHNDYACLIAKATSDESKFGIHIDFIAYLLTKAFDEPRFNFLVVNIGNRVFPEKDFAKKMGTWKLTQLKKLSFEEVKEEFDKLVKQVESFVPMNIEATKAQLKRYGEELQTEISKKQRIDDKDISVEEKVTEVKERQ